MKRDWVVEQYVKDYIVKNVQEYYVDDNGNFVFTEHYLKNFMKCCGNGCLHCPFEPKHEKGNTTLQHIYSI